jgi:hypothetical protein
MAREVVGPPASFDGGLVRVAAVRVVRAPAFSFWSAADLVVRVVRRVYR